MNMTKENLIHWITIQKLRQTILELKKLDANDRFEIHVKTLTSLWNALRNPFAINLRRRKMFTQQKFEFFNFFPAQCQLHGLSNKETTQWRHRNKSFLSERKLFVSARNKRLKFDVRPVSCLVQKVKHTSLKREAARSLHQDFLFFLCPQLKLSVVLLLPIGWT